MGMVFDIQRGSLHDGPGIRTTVFLKGCPLRCQWCHNPEGISGYAQLFYNDNVCVKCKSCMETCPNGVHHFSEDSHILEFDKCTLCGRCISKCNHAGLRAVGVEMSVEEVMREVLADVDFYENSGGGITLSGGEPLWQLEFALALLKKSKEKALHTCIETCGFIAPSLFKQVFPLVDLILFDYKLTDPDLHKAYTGVSNELILHNLDQAASANMPVIVRCPVIPGINDLEDHFIGIRSIEERYPQLRRIELMAYHHMGIAKSKATGRTEQTLRQDIVGQEIKDRWIEQLGQLGCTKVRMG
jgi:glycyl-radical enzyme activating protein